MRVLGTDVRREILNTTYPALYIVMFSIMEGESPTIEKSIRTAKTRNGLFENFCCNQ